MKLQDAYVAEKGTRAGTWKEIGYLMNNSSNFYYCDMSSCGESDNANGYGSEASVSGYEANWAATSLATLNDCPAKSSWTLKTYQNGSAGGMVTYEAKVADGQDANGNCTVLTPNYLKLDTKTMAGNK